MQKSLQRKLRTLHANSNSVEFVLGDAKESDLAMRNLPQRIARSWERPDANFPYRSREAFRDQIEELLEDSPLDLMVVSPEIARETAGRAGVFSRSEVSPAVRTAAGHWEPVPAETRGGPRSEGPLPLFGIGFCRDRDLDRAELDAYEKFRFAAGAARTRHLLELYPSCGCDGGPPQRVDDLLADRLLHSILEVPATARPLLIQAPYYGPALMESLAAILPGVPVGIVGGPAGTTFDAFRLLTESKKYGARGALFGRRIASAEHQPAFVRFLDYLARGEVAPAEAVHAYHGVLQGLGIRPRRELEEDLMSTADLHRGDEASTVSVVVPDSPFGESKTEAFSSSSHPTSPEIVLARHSLKGDGRDGEEPDFDAMTVQEKLDYNQRRRDRIFG